MSMAAICPIAPIGKAGDRPTGSAPRDDSQNCRQQHDRRRGEFQRYFTDRDVVLADRIMTHIARVMQTLVDWPHIGHPGHP
jgi:hypothetical protein